MKRYIYSKWRKTAALMGNEAIKSHIPQTVWMTYESLSTMLKQYKMVYIKPDSGSLGVGVMRVELVDTGTELAKYQFKLGTQLYTFNTFEAMYQNIVKKIKGKKYLVQKGIDLLQFRQRKFDIRVLVQKNSSHRWETTGLIGRLGQHNKIVTNYHSGGTPKAVNLLLTPHLDAAGKEKLIHRLTVLGTRVARQLQLKFPGIHAIGLDVAVDPQFQMWLLEVNTKPDLFIFHKLADKTIYRKIMRYERASSH